MRKTRQIWGGNLCFLRDGDWDEFGQFGYITVGLYISCQMFVSTFKRSIHCSVEIILFYLIPWLNHFRCNSCTDEVALNGLSALMFIITDWVLQ